MNPMLTLIRTALDAARRPGSRRAALSVLFPALALEPCRVPVRAATLRRVVALAAAASAVLVLGAASARADRGFGVSTASYADGRLVDVRVLVGGRAAPLYTRFGQWDRRYVEAFRGRDYALEVTNNSPSRVGVLIAVDGLNVVNGERSSLAAGEPMYVLGPFESTVIRGWRTSLDDIRRFVFVDEQRSYAERTGQANGDMGWIRVLAFREDRPAWRWDEGQVRTRERESRRDLDERSQALPREELAPPTAQRELRGGDAVPPSAAAPEAGSLGEAKRKALDMDRMSGPTAQSFPGTGWGEQRHDPVREVEFVAERRPVDRLTFRYEYASGLRALGILPDRDRLRDRERGELGFAKPPQW